MVLLDAAHSGSIAALRSCSRARWLHRVAGCLADDLSSTPTTGLIAEDVTALTGSVGPARPSLLLLISVLTSVSAHESTRMITPTGPVAWKRGTQQTRPKSIALSGPAGRMKSASPSDAVTCQCLGISRLMWQGPERTVFTLGIRGSGEHLATRTRRSVGCGLIARRNWPLVVNTCLEMEERV